MKLSAEEWAIAREVCTPRQLEILDLRRRGASQYVVALALGVSRSTVQSTERRAFTKIVLAEERAA